MDGSVNYCLLFGGIANIEAIFVWFGCNNIVVRITESHVCLVFMRQGCSVQLQLRSIDVMSIKKGQQSIVDTAIDTFLRKYRRYRYIKSIVDNIDITNSGVIYKSGDNY